MASIGRRGTVIKVYTRLRNLGCGIFFSPKEQLINRGRTVYTILLSDHFSMTFPATPL